MAAALNRFVAAVTHAAAKPPFSPAGALTPARNVLDSACNEADTAGMATTQNLKTQAAALFARLEGEWRLTREMGDLGTFTGHAVFQARAPDVLRYREDGALQQTSGLRLPGYREFEYRLDADQIAIHFVEAHRRGALYVMLQFTGAEDSCHAQATHVCPPDTYRHSMSWQAENAFSTVVDVTGPRKSYTLVTRYRKQLTG